MRTPVPVKILAQAKLPLCLPGNSGAKIAAAVSGRDSSCQHRGTRHGRNTGRGL